MSEQFLVSFDFAEVTKHLADIQRAYGELSGSIKDQFGVASGEIGDLIKNIDNLSTSLSSISQNLDGTVSTLNEHMKESSMILSEIEKHGEGIGKLQLGEGTPQEQAAGQVADIYPQLAKDMENEEITQLAEIAKLANEALDLSKEALEKVEGTGKKTKEEMSKMSEFVKKEISGARQGVKSSLSKMLPGIGGGLIAGLIGAMVMGTEYKQRIQAEAGELSNVFESSVDGLGSRVTRKAAAWFSEFQEDAQKYFAIGRKEVQSQVAAFVDMGYKTEQYFTEFDKNLGLVGANIPTLTLALEKHFNLAGGSSAKNVNTMVSEYGDLLDDAADKFMRLGFAAQESSIGVEKFIGSVMSGAQSMRQYGIEVEDVAQVMQRLQGYYEDIIGPGQEQFAGGLAADALGTVAGGMGRMQQGFEMAIAQEMTGLQGYEAQQEFRMGFKRIASGEDEGFFLEFIRKAVDFARKQTGNNIPAMVEFLRQNAGWDDQHARALIELAPTLKDGQKLEEGTQKQLAEFRKTFETEGKVLTELQKNQNQLIEGLAKISEGILKVITSVLGHIIIGVKTLPMLFRAMTAPEEEREEMLREINRLTLMQTTAMSEGFEDIKLGGGMSIEALSDSFNSIFKGLDEAIKFEDKGKNAAIVRDVRKLNDYTNSFIDFVKDNVSSQYGETLQLVRDSRKLFQKLDQLEQKIEKMSAEKLEQGQVSPTEGAPVPVEGTPTQVMGGPIASYRVEATIKGSDLLGALNNAQAAQVYS
jgi:methyl-accepting chemotaxis protein